MKTSKPRLLLEKLFSVPTPKELGWSKYDGLGSRKFTPDQPGLTWEDWETHVKKAYPFNYFMSNTLPDYFTPIRLWYRDTKTWLKCKLKPWKYNYYKINLAGNDPLDTDTYGYLDPCERMKKAVWYCLCQHVEHDKPEDPTNFFSKEELESEVHKQQLAIYKETMFLYNWWKVEQVKICKEREAFYQERDLARKNGNKDNYNKLNALWLDNWSKFDEKEEEMFLRVCKLRPYLWT